MTNLRSRSSQTAKPPALHRLLHRLSPLSAAALALSLALAPCFTAPAFAQPLPPTGGPVTLTTSQTYDGGGSTTGQLILNANATGTVVADGADTTITFTHFSSPASSGAIVLGALSTLVLTGSNGGGFLFDSNVGANSNSGAIFVGGTASLFIDHATFTNNTKTGASPGAIATLAVGSTLSLTNVLIASNTNQMGLFNTSGAQAQLIIASSTIQNNVATGTGGTILNSTQNNTNITLNNVLIDSNQATSASAASGIFTLNGNRFAWLFTNVTFSNNTALSAGASGGGFDVVGTNAASLLSLTNATFVSNTVGGLGGAIYFGSGSFVYNATTTAPGASLIANNTAGGASSGIYFANTGAAPVTFNTDDGASIDMLDPMTSAATAAALAITKTGAGTWNLGGNSSLTTTAAFNVTAGTLHLYRGGANAETDTSGAYTAATGNLTLAGAGAAFNLANGATLSAGGGNTITAPAITLGAASTIALDLNGAIANTTDSILTLNATTLTINNWSQTLSLLNLATFTANAGDIFNLITLAGAGAAANPFTVTSFNTFAGAALPDGYEWQFTPDNLTLQLAFVGSGNHVLLWTGAAGNTLWSDPANNWLAAGAPASFSRGDIVNLADNTPAPSSDINIDPAAGVTVAGMYVSGNQNYTITGNSITASSTVGQFSGSAAATGQLILGAKAGDTGDTIDATTAYTGTLTLSNTAGGANDFQGGIIINTGALAGNAANLGSGTGGITIDAGTLIFDQDANATYSSTIRSAATAAPGAGALVKTGTARLTLNVDDSAFTGNTDINEGTLSLADAGALGGAIHVNANAMLGGSGTATGNVTVNSTGTLNIVAAPLSILGDLTLNAGAILNYGALSTDPAASTLQLGGSLIQSGTSFINLGVIALNTGSYSLINATAANALAAFDGALLGVNFQGNPLAYGTNYDFTTDAAGILWLDILLVPLGRNNVLTWTGAASNLWNETDTNWTALGAPIAFAQGDIVNLTDTALATPATTISLTLTDSATAAAIYISGTTSYAITAAAGAALVTTTDAAATALAGTPAATGKLVLGKTAPDAATVNATAFTGTLDLTAMTTPNNFANGVEINSGALRVATTDQLGTTLNKLAFGGTTSVSPIPTLLVAGNLLFDGSGSTANRLVLSASTNGAITLEDGKTLTLTNNLASSDTASLNGAAIALATGASLTLNAGLNSWYVFTSNSASGNGGAINNAGGGLTITSATFANNLSSNNSGAIHNTGTLTLSNVFFISNTANLVAGGSNYTSGAITNSGNADGVSVSKLTVTNGYFEANNAYNGGAVTNPAGASAALTTSTITSSTFKANTATFNGGAIQAAGGQTYVANSYFTANFANNLGGAVLLNAGAQATFVNDYFYANSTGTGAGGGAIAFSGTSASLLVQSSTIEANTALNGGAFQTNGNFSLATFENTDFLNNTATTLGGAIYVGPNSQTSVVNLNVTTGTMRFSGNKAAGLANSIEWDSTANANATNSSTLAITTAANTVLDMLDPMGVGMTNYGGLDITKNGAGTWKLSGTSAFNQTQAASTHAINFDVNAGTLYLYGKNDPAALAGGNGAGNLAFTGAAANTFTLHSGASLASGGGNTISMTGAGSALTLAPGSILSYSLATPLTGYGPGGATWLTLTAPTLAIATGGIANFSLYMSTWTTGSYNLLAATQGSANLSTLLTDNAQSLLGTITYVGGLPATAPTIGINAAGQLWIAFSSTDTLANEVVAWTGAAGGAAGSNWYGANWTPRSNALFSQNDIVNLDGVTTTGATTLNLSAPATIGAMFVSGNQSYTLTGQSITTDTTAGTLKGTPANTGQLVLGAKAAAGASAVTATPFTGTLTLSNSSNTFTNGIDIRSGALVGSDVSLGSGTVGVNIASGASLTFNQAAAGTYTAPILGAGALNKNGTGNLALSANSAAFTGTTNINAGTLRITNTGTLGGLINVNAAGTLVGTGAGANNGGGVATGSVNLATGATLQIGSGAATAQTFSILGDLTLADGTQITYINTDNMLQVGGALTLTGTSTLNLGSLAYVTGSSYSLIDVTGPAGLTGLDTTLFNVNYKGALLDTSLYTLAADNSGYLWFTLLGTALGANNVLTWTNAAADNLWLTSANWTTAGITKAFVQGDIVNLTDASVNPQSAIQNPQSLTLATTATLAALYISGTTNYAITGAGGIVTSASAGQLAGAPAATGKLVLGKTTDDTAVAPTLAAFTGTLDLTAQTGAANNFTAGVEINTGALLVANNAQLGATLKTLSFTGALGVAGAGGSLIVAPGGSLLFDGGGADQSLVTLANTTGAILLQPGATMTLQNMSTGFGAITVTGSSTLSLIAAPDARFVFDHNTSTARGAGIHVMAYGALTLDGATITNNNGATGGGAITLGGNGAGAGNSTATISHALIANNTGQIGGGIFVTGPNNILVVNSSTFTGNTSVNANGGGAFCVNGNATNVNTVDATFTDVLFQGNYTTSAAGAIGGAMTLTTNAAGSTLTLTRVLFASNTAGTSNAAFGGGLAIMPAASATLTDVSFLNNRSGAFGGGLYFNGSTLAYNVATSATLAGNTYGANATTFTPNGLYLGVLAQSLTVDAAAGAHLDMIDPMAAANSSLTVTKTGAGTWNLAGANALGTSSGATINFTVSGGVLHLYRAGETSGAYTAATGVLTIGGGSFTLASGATLSAGGGNTLNAPAVTLAPDSILSLDLFNATPGGAAVLTINSTAIDTGNWTQSLDLLNIDSLASADGSIYNLITLTGGVTTFTDPGTFNFLNALPTGYSLLLSANSQTLELAYTAAALNNAVITWTGAAGNNLWSSANWYSAATGAAAGANRGDIVNIADSATPVASSTININSLSGAVVAGMYVSGTENQTIIGSPIVSTSIAPASGTNLSTLIGTPAATGKLILGASAAPDASSIATVDYTGTLTLANSGNVFDGGIEINSGVLVGNALTVYTSTSAGSEGIVIAAPGTLIFDQSFNHDYASPISGEGALVKTNTGALTLTSPATNFAGSTTVDAGALLIDNNASLGGPVQVASNATFGGIGSAGDVTLADNATLQIGTLNSELGTLNLTSLDLGTGDTLNYTTLASQVRVAGPVTSAGASTINIPTLEAGTYDLGNIPTLDDSYITVNGRLIYSDARQKAILSTLGTELILTATGDISRELYWTGASGTLTWALTGTNWDAPATGDQYVFGNGDRVHFDDTLNPGAPVTANIIDDGVIVSDMYVNDTGNTTITGEGITSSASSVFAITGNPANLTGATGKLYKTNTGTLTLNNNGNDFQGGIDLTGGVISIGGTTAATAVNATADTTLQMTAGGLLVAGTLAPEAGSTLTAIGTTGTIIFDNLVLNAPAASSAPAANGAMNAAAAVSPSALQPFSLSALSAPTAAIDAGNRLTLSGSATGDGGLLKTGDGELRFTNAALGNTGATQIDAGVIRFTTTATSNTDAAPGAVPAPATTQTILVNAGGTLAFGTGAASVNDNTIRDWSGITLLENSTGVVTGANDIIHLASGVYNALFTSGLVVAIDAGDSGPTILNNANTFTGYVRADTGVLQITDLNQIGGPGAASNTKIAFNGGAVQFSAPLPVNTIAGDIQMRPGASTLIVDDGLSVAATRFTTATGVTSVNSTLIKAGSGTFTNLGAMAASTLVIDQGRWIAVAGSPGAPSAVSGNYAPVVINDGAVLEMSIATTGNAPAVLGLLGGAPFIPTASGTINNAITGSGTLEIKTGNLVLVSPRSDIAHLNVSNGASIAITAPTFAPQGAITIDQGALGLAGDNMTLGNVALTNGARMGFVSISGTVALPLPSYSSTMVIYDPMGPGRSATLASLKTDGAADLYLNTDLARGCADHLTVNTAVSGTFNIHVTNLAATATTFTLTPGGIVATPSPIVSTRMPAIELINTPLTTTGTFLIDPNNREIDADIYKYTVSDTTIGSSYIVQVTSTGALSNAAATINSAAAALPASWFSELDSVVQRMGELHADDRDTTKGRLAVWMRGNAEKLNFNNKLSGSPFDETHYSGAAGVDYKTGSDAASAYIGLFAGYGQSTRGHNDVASDVTSDSSFVGGYITIAAKTGWYADATLKYNRFKNQFTAIAASTGETTSASYNDNAIGGSLELGKYCELPYDWFVEPQIQCAFATMDTTTYTTGNGMTVQVNPGTVTRGRAGFRVGRPIETVKFGIFNIYLKAYYGHQWTSGSQVTIATAAGQTARFSPAIKGNALEGGLGVSWLISQRAQVYFDYDTTQADYYIKPYGLNLGVRYLW